jgi:hypothetical protein
MRHEIYFPDSLKTDERSTKEFKRWLQSMANRFCVGDVRYGTPKASKKYLTRLRLELAAYKKTGNVEHLMNGSVYCFLEALAPERGSAHHDAKAASATRGKV